MHQGHRPCCCAQSTEPARESHSLSLCPSPARTLFLSKINKLQKKKKNKVNKAQRLSLVPTHTSEKRHLCLSFSTSCPILPAFSCSSNPRTGLSGKPAQPLSPFSFLTTPHSPDRGIIMTFGSGSNGCLGHGSLNDISQVGVAHTLEKRKWGDGMEPTFES